MDIAGVREALHRQPFEPFVIRRTTCKGTDGFSGAGGPARELGPPYVGSSPASETGDSRVPREEAVDPSGGDRARQAKNLAPAEGHDLAAAGPHGAHRLPGHVRGGHAGVLGPVGLVGLVDGTGGEFGLRQARRHDQHVDPVRGQLDAKRLAEPLDGELAGAVLGTARHRPMPEHRADVDDHRAGASLQVGKGEAG